jgi:hypothetical protein
MVPGDSPSGAVLLEAVASEGQSNNFYGVVGRGPAVRTEQRLTGPKNVKRALLSEKPLTVQ